MSRQRQDQVLAVLRGSHGWHPAEALADRLGVSTRSVRYYISTINARSPESLTIESGVSGYRMAGEAVPAGADNTSPAIRRIRLARSLVRSGEGIDIHEFASESFVSSASVEADLVRIRSALESDGVTLRREGTHVWTELDETLRRRLLYRSLQNDSPSGFDLDALAEEAGRFTPDLIGPIRRSMALQLTALGAIVNDFATTGIAVMMLLVAHRVRAGHGVVEAPMGADMKLGRVIDDVVTEVIGLSLPLPDQLYLAHMLATTGAVVSNVAVLVDEDVHSAVRSSMEQAASHFGVEGLDEEFLHRMAVHVERLRTRSRNSEVSRNPLTATLKTAYPLLFDVAVSVARGLQERLAIAVPEDEIAYLALHIGGQWERNRQQMHRPSAVLVSPGYYEMHRVLRDSIDRALGTSLQLLDVRTDAEADWDNIDADIVLSTIEPPIPNEKVIVISPFLTENDIERIYTAIARSRRGARRAMLRAELERYILPDAFVTGIAPNTSESDVIRMLGARLVAAGVIDDSYVQSTLDREQASSTAFTSTLAVPHGLVMSATRTAVAIGLAESSLPWGGSRVHIVAFVAFSESDREAFQTIFETLVDVFSDPETTRRVARDSKNAPAFISETVAIIDG